jgi:predicted RNA-binding Zn-ribbon protein involved in translation (DUF1610 family)
MTAIRAKCPTCGHVDLAANEISLLLHASGDTGMFGFTCPECRAQIDRPATRKVTALLIAAGVEPFRMGEDTETLAPELPLDDMCPDPTKAPLTLDDAIAFHFLLEDDAWLAELLSLDA